MIKFIKSLFGVGSKEPAKTQETVKEILIPPATPVAKVRASSVPITQGKVKSGNNIVKKTATTTTKPANGKKKPHRGKPKAKSSK